MGAPWTMNVSGRAGALAGPGSARQNPRAGEGARAPAGWGDSQDNDGECRKRLNEERIALTIDTRAGANTACY